MEKVRQVDLDRFLIHHLCLFHRRREKASYKRQPYRLREEGTSWKKKKEKSIKEQERRSEGSGVLVQNNPPSHPAATPTWRDQPTVRLPPPSSSRVPGLHSHWGISAASHVFRTDIIKILVLIVHSIFSHTLSLPFLSTLLSVAIFVPFEILSRLLLLLFHFSFYSPSLPFFPSLSNEGNTIVSQICLLFNCIVQRLMVCEQEFCFQGFHRPSYF